MNNRYSFIRNSVRCAVAALLLSAASGCGSATDGESNDSGAPPVVRPATPPVMGTNASGETLCSIQDFGVDEDGRGDARREIYNFGKINEEIARYPELAEATGISEVTDCETARTFGEKYIAFSEAHPDFRGSPSKRAIFEDFLSEPDTLGEPNPEGPEVEKVFGGVPGNRPAIVRIATLIDSTTNKYMFCSAVRISHTVFLTAAHCLPEPTHPDYQAFELFMKRKKSNGVEGWVGGGLGKSLNVYGKSYPGYTGIPHAEFDFAIFWVIKQHHALLNAELEASATTLLAPREPQAGDGQLLYGWGPASETEPVKDAKLRTPGPEPTYRGIDVVGPDQWAIHDTGPGFRLCQGDSGGGALRDGMLDGITATIRPSPAGKCSETGLDMHWSRVDTKVQFVRAEMATLQDSVKQPFKCRFHSGNPSDDTDWEHIISYIDCNEK